MNLSEKENTAIEELKQRITKFFPEAEFILFGSKARGESEEFSDIDILILLDTKVNTSIKEKIFEESFEVGLNYDVIFGIIVRPKKFWDSLLAKEMPLHWNIDKEGIRL